MTWKTITDWISQFFDKPVVISVTTILSVAGLFFVIFAKTSFGRRAIKKLTDLYLIGLEKAKNTEAEVKRIEEFAEKKVKEVEQVYEKKVSALVSIVNYYEESLFEIIELVPNAKVQAKLLDLKEKYQAKKIEISEFVDFTYQSFNDQVEEIRAEVQEEKDEQIAALKGEISELKELVGQLLKKAEEGGNGEETENTDPIEEEV